MTRGCVDYRTVALSRWLDLPEEGDSTELARQALGLERLINVF